ncbi:MAG: DUF1330 domain-containing protein [Candidatus Rokuibacteriota bacterium]|nr:MAG: DUF1330 domain-containing protein [Candidatus Rokubacteria bacterium]
MPGYVIAEVDVTDPIVFEEYRKQVPGTVQKYGGKFLARGGTVHSLEGGWQPKRLVMLEFPSVEQARRWHDSEEYRGPKAMRMKSAKTRVIVVEGVS